MERRPYRRTLADRLGPVAWYYMRGGAYGLAMFLCAMYVMVSARGLTLFSVAVSLVAGVVTGGLGLVIGHGAGIVWEAIAVDGAGTPYERDYSYEQSLVMQGRLDDALASYERIAAAEPGNLRVRVTAAELYAKQPGGAGRAAELFREARALPMASARDDIYIANRLVDLHTGPLNQPAAAMRELRRLIDRHADTPAAWQARQALRTLKASQEVDR